MPTRDTETASRCMHKQRQAAASKGRTRGHAGGSEARDCTRVRRATHWVPHKALCTLSAWDVRWNGWAGAGVVGSNVGRGDEGWRAGTHWDAGSNAARASQPSATPFPRTLPASSTSERPSTTILHELCGTKVLFSNCASRGRHPSRAPSALTSACDPQILFNIWDRLPESLTASVSHSLESVGRAGNERKSHSKRPRVPLSTSRGTRVKEAQR